MSGQQALSCSITFDFDGMSSWIGSAKSNNPSMISRGQFGAVVVPRILDLLDRYQVKSSFAVPGHTAYAYPRLVREIHDRGHELLHHGWVHENPADFDESGERRLLDQGLEALERVAGVRPTGYRSPAWDFSERTVDLLIEYGFSYDSSCMGHDFYPCARDYRCRSVQSDTLPSFNKRERIYAQHYTNKWTVGATTLLHWRSPRSKTGGRFNGSSAKDW